MYSQLRKPSPQSISEHFHLTQKKHCTISSRSGFPTLSPRPRSCAVSAELPVLELSRDGGTAFLALGGLFHWAVSSGVACAAASASTSFLSAAKYVPAMGSYLLFYKIFRIMLMKKRAVAVFIRIALFLYRGWRPSILLSNLCEKQRSFRSAGPSVTQLLMLLFSR